MKVRKTSARDEVSNLVFHPILQGAVTCHHRPSVQFMKILKQESRCSTIVTLQSPTECPQEVESQCRKHNLAWIWVPLQGANKKLLSSSKTHEIIRNALVDSKVRLERGEILLVHCAAGIHRTGLFTYALLRICGMCRESALEAIRNIRNKTYEGCGMNRFDIAEGIAQSILQLADCTSECTPQYSYTPTYR